MTERPNHEAREALIVGDRVGLLATDEAAELGLLAELLADPSTWAEPGPGLGDVIVRAVEDAPLASARSSTPRAPGVRRPRERRRRLMVAAFGAAAAVVAFVGALVAVSGGGASTSYEAQLTATALAPGAHASATISTSDAGFRITLHAHGLPNLPHDGYYAAWLRNRAGTVVPVGTFSSSDGTVTLWSGVSPAAFRTISVTIQPADDGGPPRADRPSARALTRGAS
jgi:hypothetical protein